MKTAWNINSDLGMPVRALAALMCLSALSCAGVGLKAPTLPDLTGGSSTPALTGEQVTAGLKEALTVGSRAASAGLAKPDGYNADPFVKIQFPPEAAFAEKTLRDLGMGPSVDKFVLNLNRAAEAAATAAAPIFVDAVKSMSVSDAWGILRGDPDAATQYFRKRTSNQLALAFRPVVAAKLKSFGVAPLWETLTTQYNRLPWIEEQIETDLVSYATTRAIEGLFVKLADQEQKIRLEPAARVTDLLRQVFAERAK